MNRRSSRGSGGPDWFDGDPAVGEVLAELRAVADPIDPAAADQHIALALAEVRRSVGVAVAPGHRPRWRRKITGLVTGIALSFAGTTALAAAGMLPEPLERAAQSIGFPVPERHNDVADDRDASAAGDGDTTDSHRARPSPSDAPEARPSEGDETTKTEPDPAPRSSTALGAPLAGSQRHGRCVTDPDACEATFESTGGSVTGGGTLDDGTTIQLQARMLPDGSVRGTVRVTDTEGATMRSTSVIAVAVGVDGTTAAVEGLGAIDDVEIRFLVNVTDASPDHVRIEWDGYAADGDLARGDLSIRAEGSTDPSPPAGDNADTNDGPGKPDDTPAADKGGKPDDTPVADKGGKPDDTPAADKGGKPDDTSASSTDRGKRNDAPGTERTGG